MRLVVTTSGVVDAQRALAAVYETIERSGTGEVVTSASRHSEEVAKFLKENGADPFDFSTSPELEDMFAEVIEDVMDRVARTGRTERDYIRRVMIGYAMDVAEWTRERMEKGKLGKQNTRRTADYKRRLVAAGKATSSYGNPPAYGIRTGDFVQDISGEWTARKAHR